uniref:Uncharacterized protein n=1 Tax=Arundo donax TaxID=35708 RepID=A0A0A9EL12_ARUDO
MLSTDRSYPCCCDVASCDLQG